jgi:5-methylcytosine-specific restriction endonuclease McrA
MNGLWIKMRADLSEDPSVIGIASAVGIDEFSVVGRLHAIWSWANCQTKEGVVKGISELWIDKLVALPGFAKAMEKVGWLDISTDGISFPKFENHNSLTAKTRAETAARVKAHRLKRKCNGNVTKKKQFIPSKLRSHVFDRDNRTCAYCGYSPPADRPIRWREDLLSLDHIEPESRGGLTQTDNLVTACVGCNISKNDRNPIEADMPMKFLTDAACNELLLHRRYIFVTVTKTSDSVDDVPHISQRDPLVNGKQEKVKIKKEGAKKPFVPPTVAEVADFCTERKLQSDPEEFWNYWASIGWKRNRTPIVDWKLTLLNWDKRDFNKKKPSQQKVTPGLFHDPNDLTRRPAPKEYNQTTFELLHSSWTLGGGYILNDRDCMAPDCTHPICIAGDKERHANGNVCPVGGPVCYYPACEAARAEFKKSKERNIA